MALAALFFPWMAGAQPTFNPRQDAFSFANDTVREYLPDAGGNIVSRDREDPADFAHSCFLLSRAVIQFHKFARFEPDAPKLSQEEYRQRLRRLFRIPCWFGPQRQEVVRFPGYADLWDFSADHKALLQANLGSWRLSYFRVGNFRMGFPHPRAGQALAARQLVRKLDRGELEGVYLARFPKMNHCIVLYHYRELGGGDLEFLAYDPNYPGRGTWLRYHAKERYFELEERWYFNTGRVNLMRVFISPFH